MPSPTTLRTGASPLDTSQVVNVVPEQVLKDQLPRNIDDALVNVSGITQTNTLAGTQDAVIRRGFGDNRDGSIMRNGMPLVQGRSFNPAVESVEVLKGPASLLYGIMDPGGIVNTISKRPELYQHGSVTLLGSTYGGGKSGADGMFDITGPIGKDGLAYRFIAYGVNEDYWRNFGRRRETLIAPSLAWYGENTTVQLNYEHRDFLSPFDRGTALNSRTMKPLAIPATRRLDEPYNNMWGTSDLMQASVDHRLNEDWKLYAGYSYNTESFSANQLRITAVNPVTGIVTRSNDGTQGLAQQRQLRHVLPAGRILARRHAQRGGVRWRRPISHDLPQGPDPAGDPQRVQHLQSGLWSAPARHDGVRHRQRPDRQARHTVAVFPGHAASDRPLRAGRRRALHGIRTAGGARTAVQGQHRSLRRQGAAARGRHPQAHR